jgi:hypothetical protein
MIYAHCVVFSSRVLLAVAFVLKAPESTYETGSECELYFLFASSTH